MKYVGHAGDYDIPDRGALLVRTGKMARHLLWPAIGALLLAILATAARLAGPLIVRAGIDEGILEQDKGAVTRAAIAFLVVLVIQYVTQRAAQQSVAWVGEQFLRDLRGRVFHHLLRLDMAFFDRTKTGVLVSRMTADIESMTEFVNEGAMMALTNFLTIVGVSVVMLFVDWRLALVMFAVIAVLVVVSVLFQRQAAKAYSNVRSRVGMVLATLQEGIAGVRVVQAFSQEATQAGTFGRVNESYFEANMQTARAISWYFPFVAFLRVIGFGFALLIGGTWVINGEMTFGSLVAFLMLLDWFFQPIINLANVYNLLQASLAALAKLFELLDTQPDVQERPGAYDLTDPRGDIDFDTVSFGYDEAVLVLEDVELAIEPGSRIAVVGETGGGKSTIAKLMLRFYDPTSGEVRFDGSDLRNLTSRSRTSAITLIPQDDFLFNGTLRDNLRYGKPSASDDEIWDVARAMGIDEWVRSLPDGLDTEVRERGSRFSAGERQLVALGRAFLVNPEVIVLDEATSNLDPETEVRVDSALRVLLADRTSVVIAHRLRSAQRADKVFVEDDGAIVAEGTHQELLEDSDRYRELVEIWERGMA